MGGLWVGGGGGGGGVGRSAELGYPQDYKGRDVCNLIMYLTRKTLNMQSSGSHDHNCTHAVVEVYHIISRLAY